MCVGVDVRCVCADATCVGCLTYRGLTRMMWSKIMVTWGGGHVCVGADATCVCADATCVGCLTLQGADWHVVE